MAGKLKYNLKDQSFGKWFVIERAENNNHGQIRWLCICQCGTKRKVLSYNLVNGSTNGCGCSRKENHPFMQRGERHPSWKGGRQIDRDSGYIKVATIRRDNGRLKYEREHRVVMENHIGRKLFPEETVHHIFGNRGDNKIENLELWSSRHPPGQRVSDLVKWAKEILAKYEPESLADEGEKIA